MMVYVVKMLVDDEYGCMEAQAVYASKEDADAWVAEHQEYVDCWFCDADDEEDSVPLYKVQAFELQ